jgi:hypothetical protein
MITSYSISNDINIDLYNNIDINKSYVLNLDRIGEYDKIESLVYKTINYHIKEKNIILDQLLHTIDFSLIDDLNIYTIEYNKNNKKHPILSTITYLSDDCDALFFTNVELENYKYKEFYDEHKIIIAQPEKNKQILFPSSQYYGKLKSKNNIENKNLYLKINLWDNIINIQHNYYSPDNICKENISINLELINNNTVINKLAKTNFFENLFFDNTESTCIDVLRLYQSNIEKNTDILLEIKNKTEDYEELIDKYGEELAKDIIPFFDNNNKYELSHLNRFYKNKILNNGLPKEVCYWIINESEKKKDLWTDSKYANYNNYLNIEKIPSVLNFILFISNFWFIEINNLYKMNVKFNIKDIFVSKYNFKKDNDSSKNRDDSFLTINILLNPQSDFVGDEIEFNNEEKINISQSDLLIYNGKTIRTKGNVSDGTKYILAIMLDLLL